MRSIIDGPLDIDKLDYYIRDSKACSVGYGSVIDKKRLIDNLTVRIPNGDSDDKFCIAVYEKARNSADSLSFARYLIYQTLYWHHTSRAISAMIVEICNSIKNKDEFVFDMKRRVVDSTNSYNGKYLTIDGFLDLLKTQKPKYTKANKQKLIKQIKSREYYKRVFTFHYNEPLEMGVSITPEEIAEQARKHDFRVTLQKSIQKELEKELKKELKKELENVDGVHTRWKI